MADSILRLQVESQEYDAKLKRATEGLQRYVDGCRKVGGTLEVVEKETLDYVKAIGQIETVSRSATGKLSEMKRAFTDLSVQYNQLTDAEKTAPFGKSLAASLDQLKTRIRETRTELAGIEGELKGGGFKDLLGGIAGKFGVSPTMLTGAGAAIAGVGAAFNALKNNISTAMNFETSMSQLSSLTGKTGKELDQLKNYAIELGSTTTLSASQVADAFRLIGSQQPQLLASGEALKEVTKYAIRLSEAAGIDLATASQTLSTSINQMGGDSSNAARYVNILAAASQKGAGDIAWLGEAITKSATTARAVGTGYEELVTNLEQLAKAGFDASTAGTALRSIIMNLEKQTNNEYKPSVVGLTKAFENLGKANLTINGYQEIAGKLFAAQAKALADAAGEARNMTEAISGTNIAEEQATTNTDNLSGSIKSLQSAWEGFNLHLNSSNGLLRKFVDMAKGAVNFLDYFTEGGRQSAMQNALTNDKSTLMFGTRVSGVVPNLQRLGGSNYKNMVYNEIQQMYNRAISAGIAYRDTKTAKGTGAWERAQASIDLIEAAKRDFTLRARRMMGLIKDNPNDIKDKVKKEMPQPQEETNSTSKTSKINQALTPAQQAVKDVERELKDYATSISMAQDKLASNMMTSDEYDKQVQQGQKKLADVYLKAYTLTGNEKYYTSYTEAADRYKDISEVVNTTIETQKKAKDAARELAQAQKKLTDALTEASTAYNTNDLKGYLAAMNKVGGDVIPGLASGNFTLTSDNLATFKGYLKTKMGAVESGSEQYKNLWAQSVDVNTLSTLISEATKRGIDMAEIAPQDFWSKIFGPNPGDYIDDKTWQSLADKIASLSDKNPIKLNFATGNEAKQSGDKAEKHENQIGKVVSGMTSITNSLQHIGVEIPEGFNKVINIMNIIQTIMTTVGSFGSAGSFLSNIPILGGLFSLFGAANGGVVHAANGFSGIVPGNLMSGDQVPALLNSGEVVLNRAQAGVLASDIRQGSIGYEGRTQAIIESDQIKLVLRNGAQARGMTLSDYLEI